MYRVEDKYICEERDMQLLQSRVKIVMKQDGYSQDSSYKVTSLYFDDYDESHLTDSEEGVSHRNKYRIRIYNGVTDVIKLEVKYKVYNRVYKRSRTVNRETARRLIAGEWVEDGEASMDNPVTLFNLAIRQDLLKPKVIVEYDRSAYIFSFGNVRITFDRNIRASNEIEGFLDNRCSYTVLQGLDRILEIKYDAFLPGFIAQLLENGKMNQTSYSKYRLCREQMGV